MILSVAGIVILMENAIIKMFGNASIIMCFSFGLWNIKNMYY